MHLNVIKKRELKIEVFIVDLFFSSNNSSLFAFLSHTHVQ